MQFRKIVFVLGLFFCVVFLLANKASAAIEYLDLTPNEDIVNAGYFQDISTGAANFGNATAQYNFNYQNFSRIAQNGNVDHFRMYFASKPVQLTSFTIEVWRQDGSDASWDRIYSEDMLSQVSAGTINLTPSASWSVEAGDHIGYFWTASGEPGNFLTAITVNDSWGPWQASLKGDTYYRATAPGTSNYNWADEPTNTPTTSLVPIKTFMQAPIVIGTGDSHMAGWFACLSPLENTNDGITFYSGGTNPILPFNISALYLLGENLNDGSQNMGKSGQVTSEIAARFETDVITKKPKVVIIEGGLNDINNGGVTEEQYLTNMESMINAAVENDIVPVVNLINPFNFTPSTAVEKQAIKEAWNVDLEALALAHGAIIFDNLNVGVSANGGWDVDPIYGQDGHFNSVGHAQIAQNIYDALEAYVPPYTMGTDEIFSSATTRVFGDEKFHNRLHATDSNRSDLAITIPNSNISDWIDIAVSTWETATTNRHKTWTESSTATNLASGSTNTEHIVGDLEANKYYNVQVDDDSDYLTGSGCTVSGENLVCLSSSEGKITFTFTGHYSTHTFDVTLGDNTNPVISFSNNVAAGPVKEDDISANWGDSTVKKWDYDVDGTCSITASDYSKTNTDSMDQDDTDNNGKYICLYAEDSVGNKTTLASENDINISDELDISDIEYSSTSNSITIKWETNNEADSKVKYGTNENNLEQDKKDNDNEEDHKIVLENLQSDTEYYFKIYSEDKYGDAEHARIYSIKTKASGTIITIDSFNQSEESENGIIPEREYQSFDSLKDDIANSEKIKEKIKESFQKTFLAKIFQKENQIILSEVKFQILDKNGNYIPNLSVTIHSDPQDTVTDENGVATFTNIPTGSHTITFAYQNEKFSKKVAINAPQTNTDTIQAEIITIKAEKDPIPLWVWGVMGGLVLALVITFFYKKKKK